MRWVIIIYTKQLLQIKWSNLKNICGMPHTVQEVHIKKKWKKNYISQT